MDQRTPNPKARRYGQACGDGDPFVSDACPFTRLDIVEVEPLSTADGVISIYPPPPYCHTCDRELPPSRRQDERALIFYHGPAQSDGH
jgi:hypothetical protein